MTDAPLDDPIDLLIYRVFKGFSSALDRSLAAEGIGYSQWLVLSLIDAAPGITAREIADRLSHDTGALSRIVDFLFERGLVERDRCSEDKRVVRLTVTPGGRDCSRRCRSRIEERRNGWQRQLSTVEQSVLASALTRLATAMDDDR